jgi:hypothetical protein
VPVAERVRGTFNRSAAAKRATEDALGSFIVGAAAAQVGIAAGAPPLPMLGSVGLSAAARWALSALFGPHPEGAAAVIAHLMRSSP